LAVDIGGATHGGLVVKRKHVRSREKRLSISITANCAAVGAEEIHTRFAGDLSAITGTTVVAA
jgi:hypothetical protein